MALTALQLVQRKQGIGSSDAAALVGLDPWKSPLDVWLDKTGQAENVANIPMRMGNALEPLVAELYSEKFSGIELSLSDTCFHSDSDWMLATPDRLVLENGTPVKIVECKTAAGWRLDGWGDEGTDEIPDAYLCQVQWQMLVTGIPLCDVAALIGSRLRVYTIAMDVDLCVSLADAARVFWHDHVLARVQPAIDGSESSRRFLSQLYPAGNGAMLTADEHADAIALKLAETKEQLGHFEHMEELYANQLRELIAEHDGVQGNAWRATWKKCKDGSRTDWEAVARELGASTAVIAKHTVAKLGHRTLRFTHKGD